MGLLHRHYPVRFQRSAARAATLSARSVPSSRTQWAKPTPPDGAPRLRGVPEALLSAYGPAWEQATRHPFLDAVRTGTVTAAAFDTWLAQDALFVADLLAFQARLLARAPRGARRVLAGGLVALVEELEWFQGQADSRGLRLDVPPLPATRAYADLLLRLDRAAYPAAVTALWVIERVYLLAWRHASPAAPGYARYVERWTSPEFAAYVEALERLAADAGAPDDAVEEVLALETAFWTEALGGGRG